MRCGDQNLPAEEWRRRKTLLDEWNIAHPDSSTAKLARAVYAKEYAWYVRGLGYASTVSGEQWKDFETRISDARSLLEQIETRAKADPEWYAAMLSIALVQGWPAQDFEALFRDGATKFPWYLPLYFQKAAFVSPRWRGSVPEFKQFVDDTVRSTYGELGESMYARLNWSNSDSAMFVNGQADWSRMKRGFERLSNDFPDKWNINHFAKFACIAGDANTLKRELELIGESPILEAWGDMLMFSACKAFARAEVRR